MTWLILDLASAPEIGEHDLSLERGNRHHVFLCWVSRLQQEHLRGALFLSAPMGQFALLGTSAHVGQWPSERVLDDMDLHQ